MSSNYKYKCKLYKNAHVYKSMYDQRYDVIKYDVIHVTNSKIMPEFVR